MTTLVSTVDIDSRIDEILLDHMVWQSGTYEWYKDHIKSLIREVAEELIGDMETRTTEDMALKSWTPEDYKAFGRNEFRNEQRTKLNKILGDK